MDCLHLVTATRMISAFSPYVAEISTCLKTTAWDFCSIAVTVDITLNHSSSINNMADPTAFYEPEEDELLESLAVPSYGGGDDEEYRQHMQELEQHAYAQHHEQEQAAALESVPEDVKRVSLSEIRAARSPLFS